MNVVSPILALFQRPVRRLKYSIFSIYKVHLTHGWCGIHEDSSFSFEVGWKKQKYLCPVAFQFPSQDSAVVDIPAVRRAHFQISQKWSAVAVWGLSLLFIIFGLYCPGRCQAFLSPAFPSYSEFQQVLLSPSEVSIGSPSPPTSCSNKQVSLLLGHSGWGSNIGPKHTAPENP